MRDAKDTLSKNGGSGDEADTCTDLCRVWLEPQGDRGSCLSMSTSFSRLLPMMPPLDSAYSEVNLRSTHLHRISKAEGTQVLGIRPMVSWMLLRECRCNHRGKCEAVHREPEVEHRRYRLMNCPICGKEMAKGTVISSGSMPFNTNVTFKFELHTENVRSCLILEKKAAAYYCPDCGHVIAFYKTK